MAEHIIELQNVTKYYDDTLVIDNVSFYVNRGEFITFLGPSGCGKTTTLRMIAGFDLPTSGKILLNGKDISDLPPNRRPVNTVFQRYALFPHLNVFENIAFGLKCKRVLNTYCNDEGKQYTKKEKLSKKEIREITLGIYASTEGTVITCEDTGRGIPAPVLERIFDNGFSTKGEGRGTGLHLVRQIVDRCGGEISIDTEEGEGTCFTLTFTRKEYQ